MPLFIGSLGWLLAVTLPSHAQGQDVASRRVTIATADSGVVVADHYGGGTKGVVLVHGGRYTRRDWRDLAQQLARDGAQVLAIDLRGYGESRLARARQVGEPEEALDVLASVQWLRARGATDVCVIGASLGGGAAAAAAATPGVPADARINSLLLLAPAPIEAPERITARVLIIMGATDTTASGALRLTATWEQYRRLGGPRELRTFDSNAHAQQLLQRGDSAAVGKMIRKFVRER